jgi:hypothetical protein
MMWQETNKEKGLECAKGIADWLCNIQYPHHQHDARAGTYPYVIDETGQTGMANNWNLAFAIMGLLSAHKVFGDKRYETTALRMGNYLKTLQIFDPFKKKHYGAIREISPQTPWCYTRDALSAAWSFLELYRHAGEQEYLERAVLWGEWFLKNGCDDDGWPLWGVQFEPYFERQEPQMRNDIQGSFQGGSLNFFYHLAKETGNSEWTGNFFVKMADHFVNYIQQPDGLFRSIERCTKKPPEQDPQNGLHRANDDLGTLGLGCAYQITRDKRYLKGIERFLTTVFAAQHDDGHFEESAAAIPVVLNSCLENKDLIKLPDNVEQGGAMALEALYGRQSDGSVYSKTKGGIIELQRNRAVCGRSSCYALIFLTKLFGGVNNYLRY